MSFIDRLLDPFRGKAITIPPYDGAFKPNNALDDASVQFQHNAPDNLVLWAGKVFFSSNASIFAIAGETAEKVADYDADISALAVLSDDALLVALENGTLVVRGGVHDGRTFDHLGSNRLICPTAVSVLDPTTVVVAEGSNHHAPSDWVVDLMEKRATGSVWKLDITTGEATLLADKLAWPSGVHAATDGTVHVSEAFAHRIVRVDPKNQRANVKPVLTRIPGYPGKLSTSANGGFWLSVFAPRNRLIEFVLQEDAFRHDMLKTVEREHWIAPALSSGTSFLEPLQCGSVRTMGVHKPWAPSRSYGLAVRLGNRFQPLESFHSRSDGKRHGLTSVLETGQSVLASVKGADLILDLGKGDKL
ncbi:hypothetical protein CQ052_20350 [Ochrobactrum sp. MYb15]|uniref:hypothetical protein n=1 Tax=Brucella pituitosa TaxID=571256 RepID=UPI000CFD6AFF|nr:hypothetical protein CQZ90_17675 [Ochrobactrum sp. MYb19]PRA52641.1 hypothetical protein CQ062_17110 [Ochrobactrum sp. MYb68]PRA63424.1 hypothetical protein CQ053_16205 [Ochrobactrum sp. MYb18]PRA73685.1 hypothetical protein CQ049_21855 [Brucella thiophenivorans]PRA88419.1 hypothetical protein CQ051_18120 [Ochrobactrum sp. MYb14]PRA94742.1 hypothetical protein CQ052_20350 [Ochrobactrum sp. MYb15]